MTSNALSKKKLQTKTPAICKPPPWWPPVPPPPINETTFWCFATQHHENPIFTTDIAASCKLHYGIAGTFWYGVSSEETDVDRIRAWVYHDPMLPIYKAAVYYVSKNGNAVSHNWPDQTFPTERPYAGTPLSYYADPWNVKLSCIMHEIPT